MNKALYFCNEVIQSNEFSLNVSVEEIYNLSGWITLMKVFFK